uniref:C-type lectin domain-containing protein n=1 Tax=Caenorhabditis japonica TaxID=281687 RepID=A0A8R1J0A5_CAEJA
MLSSILITLTLLVTIATCQWYGGGLDNYPFFFGHQTGNSFGNSYAGNELAGVYLFCNGVGCPGQVNLVCADGWYQIHNRCYRVLNSQYDLPAAKAACADFGKKNNFKEAQLAEYHSANLGIDLEDLNIFEAWVLVPDMSPYFENGEGVEAAVFVLDNAFLYEMKEANLMMADVKSKHEALCQYKPDINMAESFLQGELYNPIYPIVTHDLGITFETGGSAAITQNAANGQYDNTDMGKKCAGVGKVIAVKAYPQAALENEFLLFKDKLTGHRMYLTGSVKQDGAKITGFRDCDVSNPKACDNSFKSDSGGNFDDAHSLVVTPDGRFPAKAAMRAPCLCAIHAFTYEITNCEQEKGFKLVQVDRVKRGTRMCHYIKDTETDLPNLVSHTVAEKICLDVGMVLSGFEEKDEIVQVRKKMIIKGDEPHYWLGGHIPCRSDCLVDGNQKAVASWDPAVSMDNTLLHNYNHDGHPYTGSNDNKHVSYRSDLDALHSHTDRVAMWVVCGRYAKKKAVKLTPKNLA